MILGHFPAAAFTTRITTGRWPWVIPLFILAFLPDILDKSLYVVFGLTSRGYFHSIPVVIALWALARLIGRWKSIANLVAVCWIVHILCDFVPLKVLLWPFDFNANLNNFMPRLEAGAFDFWGICKRFYVDIAYPWWLAIEVFWAAACLALWTWDKRDASKQQMK